MLPNILVFCLLVSFSVEETPYTFEPESRQVLLNEGDDTDFIGFDQIEGKTNFSHCYIESKTINIDYPLPNLQNEYFWNSNFIEKLGDDDSEFHPYNNTNSSICGFYYKGASSKTPTEWNLTVYDSQNDKNYTETVPFTVYLNIPQYIDQLISLPSASLANFLISDSIKLKRCTVEFDNTKVDLDLNSIKVYNNDNKFKSRLYSLGGGKCGYKINNLVKEDSTNLILYATDEDNKTYRNISNLVVVEVDYLKNRTQVAYLGESTFIVCGKEDDSSSNSEQKFCLLYNPKGELVAHDQLCRYDINIVTLEDLGTWKCTVGFEYIMDTLEFNTELIARSPEAIKAFSEDIENFHVIGCQLINFDTSFVEFCKFTRPDGKVFQVTKGSATTNYNTFTSDLDNGKCSLEILKPLRDEDKGTWKCEISHLTDGLVNGAFIDVEMSSAPPYDRNTKKNVRLGNSFVIDCLVPFPSDYCYIIAPNGTQFKPENRLQITSGLCLFNVEESTPSDNGTWQCSIAQKNGLPDEIITVDISIIELKIISANAEATENENTELICNTNGIPVDYCRFVSPSGLSYSLRDEGNVTTTNKFSYVGRGLEYGDCGIKIRQVELREQGHWSCHISPKNRYHSSRDNLDLTRKILLSVNSPQAPYNMAESVGIAMGVLVVVISAGGFIFYKYGKRLRFRGTTEAEEATNRSSNSSGESVILASRLNASYNTQQQSVHINGDEQ